MDLRFNDEETAFRDEVRSFFKKSLPENIRRKMVEGKKIGKEDIVTWQRILNKKGWAVSHWATEWGGTGWSPVKQYIFLDEMQQAPAPSPLQFGVYMVGPVIIAFGNEAQKKRYLPRIANIDVSSRRHSSGVLESFARLHLSGSPLAIDHAVSVT